MDSLTEHLQEAQSYLAQVKGQLTQQEVFLLREVYVGVIRLRDTAIRVNISLGMPSKDVAKMFSLSPGRISQIKNSRRFCENV